jgi:hypothetical protein
MSISSERFYDKHYEASYTAATPESLIRSVIAHRRANGSTICDDDTAKEICEANGYVHKDGVYSRVVAIKRGSHKLSLAGVQAACSAMMQNIKGNVVSNTEIDRRWEICKACVENTTISDCLGCGASGRAASFFSKIQGAAGRVFRLDQKAGQTFCGMCGCSHALMVPTSMEYQKPESEAQNNLRPDQCWLRKDSANYLP